MTLGLWAVGPYTAAELRAIDAEANAMLRRSVRTHALDAVTVLRMCEILRRYPGVVYAAGA